ncbi:hypothetical protein [Saccharothrix xinjiangensis]|uniref:Uncharacterized protein n=1 Tax=Saccharothrix xinjiangensis TaxID=204798 RepID=A0ABV9Y8X7_9PSEU
MRRSTWVMAVVSGACYCLMSLLLMAYCANYGLDRAFALHAAGWRTASPADVLVGLVLVMVVDFVQLLAESWQDGVAPAWRVGYTVLSVLGLYLAFRLLDAGKGLLRHSRRNLAGVLGDPEDVRGQRFALYLRPFRDDALQASVQQDRVFGLPLNRVLTSGRTEEEQIAAAFRRFGPMVAVGTPGELLPYVGAMRLYLRDDYLPMDRKAYEVFRASAQAALDDRGGPRAGRRPPCPRRPVTIASRHGSRRWCTSTRGGRRGTCRCRRRRSPPPRCGTTWRAR